MLPVGGSVNFKQMMQSINGCSPAGFKAGKTCRMKVDLPDELGIDIGITVQKCFTDPSKASRVFGAINCIGEMCGWYAKPCWSDGQCGPAGHCVDLIPTAQAADVGKSVAELLANLGLITSADQTGAMAAASNLAQCAMDVASSSMSIPWKIVSR